jgi:hypothetical protein
MQLVETRKFYVEGPNDASFCANFRRVWRESGDGDREYRDGRLRYAGATVRGRGRLSQIARPSALEQ